MVFQDICIVRKRTQSLFLVIVKVPNQRLAKKILLELVSEMMLGQESLAYQTMKMMETLNVCGIAATILFFDLDLVLRKSGALCFFDRYSRCTICGNGSAGHAGNSAI